MPEPAWLSLARFGKARGAKGEAYLNLLCDDPEWLRSGAQLYLRRAGENPRPVQLEDLWIYGDRCVCKLAGVDTMDVAAGLRGAEICIRRQDRRPAGEGEYYLADLAGCAVTDVRTGAVLGTVRGWQETGGAVLLEVEPAAGGELLIPFAASICVRVEPEAGRIEVALPPGLLELNKPGGEAS